MRNTKVLVTGADGFIGSHLVEILFKNDFEVRALSQYNSFNDWGWLEDIGCKDSIEIITGDIRDYNCCQKITQGSDIIVHLAALIGIPYSYYSPKSYVDTNITGTLNLCQSALENSCQKFIHTSTSEVYGSTQYVPINENHPLHAQSPYSATKIGADSIALSYFYSFNLPVSVVRPFNTYGPRQSARAVIPTIISQLVKKKKIIKLGDISTTRDFTYVSDTCNGFIMIAKNDKTTGEIINIGSNYEISIEDLFNKIKNYLNFNATIEQDGNRLRPKRSEVLRLWCDNSKAQRITGFNPKISIDDGLKKTIKWFSEKENIRKYKTGVYNV